MYIYIRKLFEHDIDRQISFTREVAVHFFNVSQNFLEQKENVSIHIFHYNNEKKFEDIELQPATDFRFSLRLNTFITSSGDSLEVGDLLYMQKIGKSYGVKLIKTSDTNYKIFNALLNERDRHFLLCTDEESNDNPNTSEVKVSKDVLSYLSAIRTKPFLLLAGISGTGKSRIVKEMAYASCPDEGDLRKDKTSPGNYCLVEVKPNWNDSTELLGYETVLDGGNYHLTKFVKFLIKAMQHENVPFFVCLDEMNLAAVEQYFAEFLSILESRKDVDGTIKSEPLIPAAIFEKYQQKLHEELFPTKDSSNTSTGAGCYTTDGTAVYLHRTYAKLMEEGLRIPRNLIVVGTVNMDDTTYQFSRKVIDRAMTIEMNEVNLNDMFDIEKPDALSYREDVVDKGWFFAPFAQSNNVLQQMNNDERELLTEKIKTTIGQTDADGTTTPDSLEAILGKTPFRIAYRVVNELILHFYALRCWENKDTEFEELYNKALDNILMMKVLPRIEGNEDLVKEPLAQLATWTEVAYPKANAKIVEMRERLELSHFTCFWP
mgnify:FL=1|jgi:hypothetical protein